MLIAGELLAETPNGYHFIKKFPRKDMFDSVREEEKEEEEDRVARSLPRVHRTFKHSRVALKKKMSQPANMSQKWGQGKSPPGNPGPWNVTTSELIPPTFLYRSSWRRRPWASWKSKRQTRPLQM